MPNFYEICVEGQLDPCWSEWLEGMTITPLEGGETLLTGPVADQAALYGLLNRLRDMNLTLICVRKSDGMKPRSGKRHQGKAGGRRGDRGMKSRTE